MKRKILLVDGYNMIAFWQETRQLFQKSELDAARNILLQKLSHYASFEGIEVICVFDAQYTPLHQVSVATSDLNEQWTVFVQGALRVSARELEKRVAVVKGNLNQAQRVVNDQKPPMRPLDHEVLRQLQEMMGDK